MKILYIGVREGNSLNRAEALGRLGHEVRLIDPFEFLPRGKLARRVIWKLIYELGGGVFGGYVGRRIRRMLAGARADLVWVNGGELVGPGLLRWLRTVAPVSVGFNNDDPFGPRDKRRFALFRRAVPEYDLVVVVREVNMAEARRYGARHVLRVRQAADEVAHAPVEYSDADARQWAADVVFVGTWMPERGPFMRRLVELGVPLKIRGDEWHHAPEWPLLRKVWAGPAVYGRDYVKSIQYSKVCLCLLSKGNRDTWTARSAEIPFIGSVLCAERTADHMAMYEEDREAVFWSTAEECAQKCHWLLSDEETRRRIALAGQQRCIRNGLTNERMLSGVLEYLKGCVGGART